jgi:hypothetical protein
MKWTEEQFADHIKSRGLHAGEKNQKIISSRPRPRHTPGKMNKTEEKYAAYLELRKRSGEIIRWVFEPFKLRLADNTFYHPDFMVVTAEQIEIHEYKGHWEDDARVKIKVAAELFPEFQFIAARTDETGSYQFEYFK